MFYKQEEYGVHAVHTNPVTYLSKEVERSSAKFRKAPIYLP